MRTRKGSHRSDCCCTAVALVSRKEHVLWLFTQAGSELELIDVRKLVLFASQNKTFAAHSRGGGLRAACSVCFCGSTALGIPFQTNRLANAMLHAHNILGSMQQASPRTVAPPIVTHNRAVALMNS